MVLFPPWHLNAPNSYNIYCSVPGITSCTDNTILKTRMSNERIDNHCADYIIYTDGSVTLGSKDGGFAVVITQGSANNPRTIDTIKKWEQAFTCSFEELSALSMALHSTKDYNPTISKTVLICSDRKSLCEALLDRNASADCIRMLLHTIQTHIITQWITGHSNIPGNDLADRVAKQATELPHSADLPITFSSALNVIKKVIRDPAIAQDRMRESYANYSLLIDNAQITTREDKVLIERLPSGHHPALQAYLHQLDPDTDPVCPTCKDRNHTLNHWLITCLADDPLQQKVLGCLSKGKAWVAYHLL